MSEYHKIHTVYKRDPATKFKTLLLGEFALPEFQYLASNEWEFTEKVDGTNIRVMWEPETQSVRFGGKTDRAQIPAMLLDRLQEMFRPCMFASYMSPVVLYGEGYGAHIQKGGGRYIANGTDFVLFDVIFGGWWLKRKDIEDVASHLGCDVVPVIGHGDLIDMVEIAADGFESKWGPFTAEGIVARPSIHLMSRKGERIITKIKHKDFA